MNHKVVEYDYEAANYDKIRFNDDIGRHLDCMHKKILSAFLGSPSKRLLEVGLGTGRFGTWLAEKGFDVIGVDLSKEMLKKAEEKKTLLNVDLELVQADANFLPFRSELFDSCFCINVLDHLDLNSISNFFKNAKQVIKPQGSLIFNFSNIQSPYLPIAALVNIKKQALFKRGKIFSVWLTLKKINTMLSKTGFVTKSTRGCMIASPIPYAGNIIKIISIVDSAFENSKGKLFCGSIFVKAGHLAKATE